MILVTGASGLLGSNLTAELLRKGERVAALSNRHPIQVPEAICRQVDLCDRNAVFRIVEEVKPRWIFHCAAATDVDWCEAHPDEARRINSDASRFLAEAARRAEAGMVYVSTSAVFDGRRGQYSEEDEPGPRNAYARSKLAGERAVREELPSALIVRTDIYGWNMRDKQSLAEWILGRLRRNASVPGFQDAFFSPVLVNDLSAVIWELSQGGFSGVFHAGAGDSCSKYDFALRLARLYGHSPEAVRPSRLDDSALKAPRPLNVSLRAEKVARALGRAMPGVDEGLRRFKSLETSGFVATLKSRGEEKNNARV
jgi:dTDP-4-dehydrorhamnose reductase